MRANIHFQYTYKWPFREYRSKGLEIPRSMLSELAKIPGFNREKTPSNFGDKIISNIGGTTLEIWVFG